MSGADDFNARGYWESATIREFNDRVLRSAGSDWKDWSAFDLVQAAPKMRDWESELAELVRQEFDASPLIVIKDPRLCRIAPIMLGALGQLDIAPKIVLTVRNPLESAESLQKRDRMPREEALLLWLRHVLDAEKASRGYPRCFVAFDDLISDWRRVSQRLSVSLDITWPKNVDEPVERFLSSSLRNHRLPRSELNAYETSLPWIPTVYDILMGLARDGDVQDQLEHLDEVRRNFDAAAAALRPIVRARDALMREARDRESRAREEIASVKMRAQDRESRAREEIASVKMHAQDRESRAREEIASVEMHAQEAAKRAQLETDAARRHIARTTQEFETKLEAVRSELARQEREFDRIRSKLEMRARKTEAQNKANWRELVQAKVALHKARAKSRPMLWQRLSQRRTTETERERQQADLIRTSGAFDVEWYLARYPDVKDAGIDPILHYLRRGVTERRDPSARFSTSAYLRRHLDVASAGVNPLLHFLEYGIGEQREVEPSGGASSADVDVDHSKQVYADHGVTAEHAKFTRRGSDYEDFDPTILAGTVPDVKLLAFYLPQFHAISENDRHWGKGFTEWRQIVRGLPRFPGHYQPRVPHDLGFYDLTDADVMRRQIAMARAAGIYGFGFYYYWFDAHRVLEQPVETFLASPDMDVPFIAIWANENWTRTWDGMSGEVLLQQSYNLQHEPALLADLARHFRDPRYIRFGDRPLFVIYQPRHVPNARETFARWRMHWKSEFGLDPLIFMAQTFGVEDPRQFGLDGALEFPPHKLTNTLPGRPVPDAFDAAFAGRVVSYDEVAAISLRETAPDYPLVKTIIPSWDNDARRPMCGTVMEGSTPHKYQRWLSELVARARAKPVLGERIVGINAWNEWAEGAYLEPDLYYGSAYLNATARALLPRAEMGSLKHSSIVLVGHDALDFGAQRLLLSIGTVLVRQFGVRVQFVLLAGGPMLSRYEAVARCIVLTGDGPPSADQVFADLAAEDFKTAITNTTVTGCLVGQIKSAGFRVLSLIHEMPGLIRSYDLEESAAAIGRLADAVVFAGSLVRDSFRQISGEMAAHTIVKPQGLYRDEITPDPGAAETVREALGLPRDAKLVLNIGYGDLRKGFDLFTRAAESVAKHRADVYFVWVGKILSHEAEPSDRDNRRVIAVGHQHEVSRYYGAADVFFLSSREDPYPSVVLEAMAAGLPVIGFAGATGCEELIKAYGAIVPLEDIDAVSDAIDALLAIPADHAAARAEARIAEIRSNYDFKDYCFWLLQQFHVDLQRVSVVVPNYNHERHLEARLGSIFDQSYPVYQIVVLDDASIDGSVPAIRRIAAERHRDVLLITSEANGGSLAKQWRKGLAHCTGDFVWIAESDDVADPAFLVECMRALERSGADFCFTDSWQIDGESKRIGDSYIGYIDDIEPGTFDRDFDLAGEEFLRRFLSAKNVILNMSGVLWRRASIERALDAAGDDLEGFRVAGDWRLYAAACRLGQKVCYMAKALNGHRRHATSVTTSLDKQRHIDEIKLVQQTIARWVPVTESAAAKAKIHLSHVHAHLGVQMQQDVR